MTIIIAGKGELDKNEYEHFFVDICIVLANLHNGKVYKYTKPFIDVETHKLRSLLQWIWLIGSFWSFTVFNFL